MTDLEWLARNVHEWGSEHAVKELEYAIDRSLGECVFIDGDSCICKEEWLQKRAELQGKPSWDDAPCWAEWLGQDGVDAKWCWYGGKPDQINDGKERFDYAGIHCKLTADGGEVLGNWQDTLEERPSIGVTDVLKHAVNTAVDGLDTGKIVPQSSEPPTWNGEGLPPVGCECEHKNGNIYTVTGHANVATEKPSAYPLTIIYKDRNGATWSRPASDWGRSFKPFKTERQKAVEELASFLNDVVEECESGRSMDAANYLYDQGYRKTS